MKTKIYSLAALLIFETGAYSLLAQPSLGISPAGDQSILYWSATPTNYLLQSTTNLAAPNWIAAADGVPVLASAVSNTSPARFFRLIYINPPVGMALIPAGTFTMGDTLDGGLGDANPTNIFVSAFYMDTNLVTYNLWQTVYNAATTFDGYSFVNAGAGKAANHPVQSVDWYDCVKWCNARSQLAGLTPVYYTDSGLTQVYKTGEVSPYVNGAANGFRLPTEAEWEKAARGGSSGRRFPWGNHIDENQANYYGDIEYYHSYDLGPDGFNVIGSVGGVSPATSPVGSFDVNGYGLYDMTGNVFEWCWDWYGTPFGQPTPANPTGPTTGSARVLRGGSWSVLAGYARCAYRNYDGNSSTGNASNTHGFPCVKGL